MAGGTAAATQPPVLRASGLGKAFLLTRSRVRPLLRRIVSGGRGAPPEGAFWAVRDVSFEIARGESLGLIGRNGSGKSTLLRMLGRVARPTTGFVESTSRLACLLDLGVGFHALETGRQNAEAWLMLLAGMRRGEARRATLEVERFAEIGDHFDRPLRTYSAGMQMRVAFAVATLLSPEVLVADEVLAVGDAAFQKRCEAFFDRFLTGGGSLILCAHDMHQIQRLCGRTLWLDGGRTMRIGDSRDVVRHYRAAVAGGTGAAPDPDRPAGGAIHEIGESRGLPFEVVDLHLRDESGRELRVVDSGTTVVVEADVVAPAAVPHVHLSFVRGDCVPVYGVSSDMDGARPASLGGGRFRFRLTFPELPLLAGGYVLKAHALDETATRVYDTVEIAFEVLGAPHEGGLVRVPAEWH